MHFWELQNYIKGYNEIIYRNEEDMVKLAYQTAAFMNSKKKPKSLEYYIKKIRNSRQKFIYKKDKVDVDKSRSIEKIIQELKEKRKEVK